MVYRGEHVEVCAVIDPECAAAERTCPIRDVIEVGAPNTYLDPDADDENQEKGHPKSAWWKLWGKKEGPRQ